MDGDAPGEYEVILLPPGVDGEAYRFDGPGDDRGDEDSEMLLLPPPLAPLLLP